MNKQAFAIAALAVFVTAGPSFAAVSSKTAHNGQTISATASSASRVAANEKVSRERSWSDSYGWKTGGNTG